jgi:hypothetical protein
VKPVFLTSLKRTGASFWSSCNLASRSFVHRLDRIIALSFPIANESSPIFDSFGFTLMLFNSTMPCALVFEISSIKHTESSLSQSCSSPSAAPAV